MFTPLILFLGLTVATAFIAHWSDNLGKKLGKKRVTLMGLRPRTTATILTITSSWAIMLFTLVALLVVVPTLRHALFTYDREISAAKTNLEATKGDLSQAQQSLRQSNQQFEQSQSDLEKAQAKAEKALQDAKKAAEGAEEALAGEETARKRAESARKRAETARKREREARRNEHQAEQLREQANQELEKASASLHVVQAKFNNTENSLTQTQAQLVKVRTRLNEARSNYYQAHGEAFRVGRQKLDLESQIGNLDSQRAKLQQQVNVLATTAQIYSDAAMRLAGGDVRIGVGKTFAARIIEVGESPRAILAELRQLLAQGESAFAEADETKPLYEQGARLILFPLPEKGTDNTPDLRTLARIIAVNGATTSVRLVAAFNFTAEEKQIAVRFVAVPVAVAFRAGETLTSATIQGSVGDALIFRALNNLIETGRETAIKRSVNPPLSPDEPTFYAEGTSVGLFDALRRIEAAGKPQRVRLVAAEELSTVEPLRVRFVVEAAPVS